MAEYNISARLSLKDQMTAQLKSAYSAAQKLTRGIGDVKDKDITFRVNVQGQEKINRMRDILKQAGHNLPPINLRVNDSGATSKISKIRSEVTALASKPYNVMVNIKTNGMAALGKAKGAISEMATGAAMGMGAGMLGVAGVGFGAVDMVNTYKDFNYQMMRNKALFTTGLDAETAEKQYHDLEKAARHYGSVMKFTASEVGKAEEYMALAGWDAPTAIAALPAVLNAAVASGEDLALVSDIITDDMTAMGYKAGDVIQNAMGQNVEAAQHFADVMLRTTLRSNTNFQQLGLAMKYAAPLAHTLGYKIEDVAVAMGLMANNGIKADQAGTGLRGILNRFISTPKKAAESMERLGVSLFDAQGNAKSLIPMLMDVRAALKGQSVDSMIDFAEQMTGEQIENRAELTDFLKEAKARGGGKISAQDQAKLGSMLSGTYAMAAFMSIMNSSDEDIKKLMTEIYQKSDGTGADVAKQMANTLSGDLDTLKSAWEDFNVELLSGGGGDGLRSFVQGLTKDINQFKTSLKDGLDFGDIASLGINVLQQLKNKFLELDGIGSALAGGALFMAMKKILSMGLKIKDTLSTWSKVKTASDLGGILRGNQGGVIGTSQVGTMHVNAGVVNLNGAVRGGTPIGTPAGGQRGGTVITNGGVNPRGGVITTGGIAGTNPNPRGGGISPATIATTGAATAGSILLSSRGGRNVSTYNPAIRQQEVAARNSAYVNDYYARRASFVPPVNSPIPPATSTVATGAMGTLRASAGAIGGAGILSAIFGAMDIYSTRQHSAQTMEEATATVQYQKNVLATLQSENASQESIVRQMQEVRDAEAFVERTKIMNGNMERQSELGAAGAVTGALAGAAIGSFVPVIGTAIGGMIGGILGQFGGIKLAEHENERQAALRETQKQGVEGTVPSIPAGSVANFRQEDEVNLAQYQNSEYQSQLAQAKAQREAQEVDNAVLNNAAGISRHQTSDYLESQGIKAGDLPSADVINRHKGNSADVADTRQANFQYQQDHARMEYLAAQRDEYNKRWQQQFGGTSLGGQANFVPDNERDRQLLKRYDEEQANKIRQKNLIDSINAEQKHQQAVQEALSTYEKSRKQFADLKTTQQAAEEARKNSSHAGEKFFKGIGNFFDDLLFSKAAASPLETENVSTPAQIPEPPKPSGGFFDNFFTLPELPNLSEIFSGIELPDLNNFLEKIPNLSEIFSGIELPNLSEIFNLDFELPDFGTKISELFTSIDIPDLGAKLSEIFSGIELPELGISEKISAEFEGAMEIFSGFTEGVTSTFSGLAGTISGALSGVGSAITSVFSSAASEVQGVWGAMPGFFGGVFGSLGGVAAAAGGAIASGLTGVIGGIIGAWQSAAATISGIISSIASAAANAAASAGSFFGGIGSNAKGTASWKGGFTEINEHGGEIINLPRGTQIIPHATTVNILKHEIRNSISNGENNFHGLNFADYAPNNFSNTSNFETNNILGGDVIYPRTQSKPNKKARLGQRWNMKPSGGRFGAMMTGKLGGLGGVLGDVLGGILIGGMEQRKKNISLGEDIDTEALGRQGKVRLGQRWNMKPSGGRFGAMMTGKLGGLGGVLGDVLGGILIGDYGGQRENISLGGDVGLPMMSAQGQNFSDSLNMPFSLDDKFNFDVPKFETPKVAESSSNSTSNSNTFNFGGVNINNGADFDEFCFRISQLMKHSAANSELA